MRLVVMQPACPNPWAHPVGDEAAGRTAGKFGQAEDLRISLKQNRYKNIRFISILGIGLGWK